MSLIKEITCLNVARILKVLEKFESTRDNSLHSDKDFAIIVYMCFIKGALIRFTVLRSKTSHCLR